MRVKGATLDKWLLGLALVAGLLWNVSHAGELKSVRVSTGPTGTRAELQLGSGADYTVIPLANPERLVVDLADTSLRAGLRMPAASGVIKAVRSGKPAPDTTRIVFDLAAPVAALKPRMEPVAGGTRLVIEWPGDGPVDANADADAPALAQRAVPAAKPDTPPTPTRSPNADSRDGAPPDAANADVAETRRPSVTPAPGTVATGQPTRIARGAPLARAPASRIPATPLPMPAPPVMQAPPMPVAPAPRRMTGGMRPLVIAIDAGHGGQDSGAIGLNGTREKDVTLAIARELARQIDATPGLKAYLTRDSDYFIPLPQRARRARQAKADIFVSVHADAAENRSASGSSVYVLSLRGASSQRARWLADKENAADVIGGERVRGGDDTLTSVLLDLTQSGNMKASEDAATHVLGGLGRIGNHHKSTIEKANFAVLRTSDKFPAMLVETAFISNPTEEQQLRDPGYQRALASAILGGIDDYFSRQPPPGTLYATRALAAMGVSGASLP